VAEGQPQIDALRSSVERLQRLAAPLSGPRLDARAYPTDWTVAQVLSHLGSGAVILQRRLEDALAGKQTPEDFAPGVWETWNSKAPAAQRDEALAADAALLARLDAVPVEQREHVTFAMGPMSVGFGQFVGLRLNEHAFHTWDIEVVSDAAATIPAHVAELVVDNLALVARFTARPTGGTATVTVATTEPGRGFAVVFTTDDVALEDTPIPSSPDLVLAAEAFARLVYGRLDTARGDDGPALATLRSAFPGP
jgi:uncharacterized protein (TIGR03083 family)